MSNAMYFHLVSLNFDLNRLRVDVFLMSRSIAYYTVLQVELFYFSLQDTASIVGWRNKCNQDGATIQRRDFGAFGRRRHHYVSNDGDVDVAVGATTGK